jgi:hypothetical protein
VLSACPRVNCPTPQRALLLTREQGELRPKGRSTSRRLDLRTGACGSEAKLLQISWGVDPSPVATASRPVGSYAP